MHEAFGAESPKQEHHVAARNELRSRAASSASRIPAWLVLLPVDHASDNPFQMQVKGTLLEAAFSWLASHPSVASVIAGATRPEQVEANVDAVGWRLTPEELAEIDRLSPA